MLGLNSIHVSKRNRTWCHKQLVIVHMLNFISTYISRSLPAASQNHDDVLTWKRFPHYWWGESSHWQWLFSALLAICAGNSPVTGEFSAQRPVTRSFGVFFDRRLNKPLSKQSWGWWCETLSRPLWCHCNDISSYIHKICIYETKR